MYTSVFIVKIGLMSYELFSKTFFIVDYLE